MEPNIGIIKWHSCINSIPPLDKLVLLRGIIRWKPDNQSVKYFSDKLDGDQEILEYGRYGYTIDANSDYLVIEGDNPEEVCDEYITHWAYLNEPDDL